MGPGRIELPASALSVTPKERWFHLSLCSALPLRHGPLSLGNQYLKGTTLILTNRTRSMSALFDRFHTIHSKHLSQLFIYTCLHYNGPDGTWTRSLLLFCSKSVEARQDCRSNSTGNRSFAIGLIPLQLPLDQTFSWKSLLRSRRSTILRRKLVFGSAPTLCWSTGPLNVL